MKQKMKDLTLQAWIAIALALIAACTFVVCIVIPPPGEVHPSVIQGMALMVVLVAIFFAWDAVIRGLNAKVEHGDTKVSIEQPKTTTV